MDIVSAEYTKLLLFTVEYIVVPSLFIVISADLFCHYSYDIYWPVVLEGWLYCATIFLWLLGWLLKGLKLSSICAI
jgi:hypothetical protein